MAAALKIDWSNIEAEEKYAAKREREAGTMKGRLAKLAAMGRVGGTVGVNVEKPSQRRSGRNR